MTFTVPAKKEGGITFVPYNGTISLEVPTGMYATVVLTIKDGHQVQQHTFYIAELEEHGADLLHDPPLRPCINPFWLLQKLGRSDDQSPNMMQRIIQVPCSHAFTFPEDIKVQGSTKQIVSLEIPVLVNSGPLDVGETLLLE